MLSSPTIKNVVKKKAFTVSLKVSVFLFCIFSGFFFSEQFRLKQNTIEKKIEIDDEFIVNAVKIGDLFFITKYLAAFVKSGVVTEVGLREKGSRDWLSHSSPEVREVLDAPGFSLSWSSVEVLGAYSLGTRSLKGLELVYRYRISHFFLLRALVISIFFSFLIFFFLSRVLLRTSLFFTEPVENLAKDIDLQFQDDFDKFSVTNYSAGYRFKETDSFVSELSRLLSEIRLKNEKIKEAEVHEALSRLGRQVNHDIQSPLGALKTGLQNLENNKEKSINLINKSVERIQAIVSDLKIQDTKGLEEDFSLESVDLNKFVGGLVEEKQLEYKSKNVIIDFSSSLQEVTIKIDRVKMARALSNIINNGIEAVKFGVPHIKVGITSCGEDIVLDIIDNGCGVDDESLALIFSYGFTSKNSGTGLGLDQVKKTLEIHNFKYRIDNLNGKSGVSFKIYIRVA